MTFVSKLAMAAVLTLGATTLAAAPAAAQKNDRDKKDQEAGGTLKLSPEFRKVAGAAEVSNKAKDWAGAEPNITAAEGLAKNDDEKYFAGILRLDQALGQKNEDAQLKAVSALMGNPRTPPPAVKAYSAFFNFTLGARASVANKHAETIQYLLKAREFGSLEVDLPVLLANAYSATGKQAEAVAEVDTAIQNSKAAGRKPPESWYLFVIPKVNAMGDRAAMASWLSRFITEYPTVKNWLSAIQIFRRGAPAGANAKVERIDLYRLLRATNALPNRGEYADYAYATQQGGLPWEAISVVDEGRKAGKIPAGDADVNKVYAAAQTQVKTSPPLETFVKEATAAKDGKSATGAGDAFLASGNFTRAIELYDMALTKGGVNADEVNLHRGIAFQRLGQKEQARTAFGAVKAGPLANLATLYVTSLDLPALAN